MTMCSKRSRPSPGRAAAAIGAVISDLARRALKRPPPRKERNGIPLLASRDGAIVTQDIVNSLRDELP